MARETKIVVNRAPVLTLWATVVAERLGYDHAAALTLGKAVAGLNAQSKGRRLGIIEELTEEEKAGEAKARPSAKAESVTVLGRPVPVVKTGEGVRAAIRGEPIQPEKVQRYLKQRFGEQLAEVQAAMEALARAYPADQLAKRAYALYEKFRPDIPEGKRGWGAKGDLDLDLIRSLAHEDR